ncbi:protein translocase subunit SecF [Candidatus Vampirococcus lugosii]|uniref:Protein translocase subunit SecF n=1 Tax=Candidatus Vampirococcus lugosii TaxID=2789015 RepID=A0ABS5QNM4_9BACT|nr:protein translocase subunit SecF [Candidatus Vampirococcus lugosii]MBS8122529.1 Protein translocase subunit secF [Candidatus Vampirococcus lugosii]
MDIKFSVIKNAMFWIVSGVVLMLISLILFFSNLRLSIQFTGGMELILDVESQNLEGVDEGISKLLVDNGFDSPGVYIGEKKGYPSLILELDISDDKSVDLLSSLTKDYLIDNGHISSGDDILENAIIGPSIGDWMKKAAITAILFGLLFIGIYMLFAFSGIREYLSPGLLALVTMFTLLFDVLIPAGAYGIFMFLNSAIQVDLIFIVSILTIMGYSINDTIIIFDRIRENISYTKEKKLEKDNGQTVKINKSEIKDNNIDYVEIFDKSIWQTMRRSLATSFSTLLVLISMFIFGGGVIQLFSFTLMIGVIAGTFSSIFFATSLTYIFGVKNSK